MALNGEGVTIKDRDWPVQLLNLASIKFKNFTKIELLKNSYFDIRMWAIEFDVSK